MILKTLILALVVSITPSFSFADAVPYKLLKDKSSLKFYAINNNSSVAGEFKDFSADIKFDREKPENSKIKVAVDIKSIYSDAAKLAETLQGNDWLSVSKFPQAVFVSKTISKMPNSENYYADGMLELHGKTLPVSMNFQASFPDDKTAIATGYITLRRTDFGIGQGAWAKDDVLKNEVRVEFRVVAER